MGDATADLARASSGGRLERGAPGLPRRDAALLRRPGLQLRIRPRHERATPVWPPLLVILIVGLCTIYAQGSYSKALLHTSEHNP